MEKLKLPVIKGKLPQAKQLSMNDYARFVELGLKYTLDRKILRKWKKLSDVKTPFCL